MLIAFLIVVGGVIKLIVLLGHVLDDRDALLLVLVGVIVLLTHIRAHRG